MNISYRTRRFLIGLATTVLIIAVVAALLWLCWMIWVSRYIVYHRDGPRLDFSLTAFDGLVGHAAARVEPPGIIADPVSGALAAQVGLALVAVEHLVFRYAHPLSVIPQPVDF